MKSVSAGAVLTAALMSLFAVSPAHAGEADAELNCRDPANNQRCSQILVRASRSDAFLQAILRAQKARLPEGWKCGDLEHWEVKGTVEESEARAMVVCRGPEQHLILEFRGDVRLAGDGWTVYVTSFVERVGD